MHRLYGEIQIRKTGIKKEFSDYKFEKDCYILFVKAWRVHGLAFDCALDSHMHFYRQKIRNFNYYSTLLATHIVHAQGP